MPRTPRAAALAAGTLAVLLAALLSGCAAPIEVPTGHGSTAPVRHHARIIVVIEENHSYHEMIEEREAPHLVAMARQGTLLTNYFAITHPSLPNYIALLTGGTQHITTDCAGCTYEAPTLVGQLAKAGDSWRAYMEGLPTACSNVATAGPYARRHDPFMYFASIRNDPRQCGNVLPLDRFFTDLKADALPDFVWVTPNLDDDMHGGTEVKVGSKQDFALVARADQWLQAFYTKLRASKSWGVDTRLVVTWDEGLKQENGLVQSCCGTASGGHIPTVVVGPRVPQGVDSTPYSHYSLLRSIEAQFSLPLLGHAADPSTNEIPAVANPVH